MFRISQYMQLLANPKAPLRPAASPPGPVVIWNLLRRCNLTCKHCYAVSADKDFDDELSTPEIYTVMDDLRAFGVPVLILSGGEPLLHPDIFDISARAKRLGFYVGLSSNGTLIGEHNIGAIAASGYDYVGISIDGMAKSHDAFRRKQGAFDEALQAVRLCRAHNIKVGLRFTLTRDNAHDLPAILRLMENEEVDKLYLSHLNYAGRGNKHRGEDVVHRITRNAMDLLFETALADARRGRHREFVTGNNDADGVYLLKWVEHHYPDQAARIGEALRRWGGNASGVNIANIDNTGTVHPDTMWWHYPLGNVRERPFSEIWQDTSDPLMAGLKQRPRPVSGRCGACRYLDICNGNTRVRAQQLTGDPWAEDPACYLNDEEIGVNSAGPRLENTPYPKRRQA